MKRGRGLLCLAAIAALASTESVARAQDIDTCIAASERAVSLRKADKLIDARTSLATCAAPACPDAVRVSCVQRLTQMSRAIPSIVFFAKDKGGHDLAAAKLSIDGAPYADHLDGAAIELNPGEHDFRFDVAGREPVVQHFVLHQGEQNRHENVVLEAPTSGPASPSSGASDGSSLRTTGLVVGGVGAAALVVGGIFGALAIAAHSNYEQYCGAGAGAGASPTQCRPAGVSGESDAATKGTVSTVMFIGGGVLAAAGATVFFLAPSKAGAQVGIGPGSLVLKGQF